MFIHRDIIIIVGETPYFWTALINDHRRTLNFSISKNFCFPSNLYNELNRNDFAIFLGSEKDLPEGSSKAPKVP